MKHLLERGDDEFQVTLYEWLKLSDVEWYLDGNMGSKRKRLEADSSFYVPSS